MVVSMAEIEAYKYGGASVLAPGSIPYQMEQQFRQSQQGIANAPAVAPIGNIPRVADKASTAVLAPGAVVATQTAGPAWLAPVLGAVGSLVAGGGIAGMVAGAIGGVAVSELATTGGNGAVTYGDVGNMPSGDAWTLGGIVTPADSGNGQGFIAGGTARAWFNGKAYAIEGAQSIIPPGKAIIGIWNSQPYKEPDGWTFFKLNNGKFATFSKSFMWREWRTPRPIVLSRGHTSLSSAVKAQKYLDKMWRNVARKTKALKLA